jgi:hypothetical protein
MEIIKIEKGIPYPKRNSTTIKNVEMLLAMKVGQCTSPIGVESISSARNWVAIAQKENPEQKYSTRRMEGSTNYRIWRIK